MLKNGPVYGSNEDNHIIGSTSDDIIYANGGNDTIERKRR